MLNNINVPHKISSDATTAKYGRFNIGPLESGYGIIIGNALRRVLLSSLPGAAVTSIRVSGVHHEFSTIPYVREDMTQLVLRVKELRIHMDEGVESARLRLEHHGEGTVTAADIATPPGMGIEIENAGMYLFTVDKEPQFTDTNHPQIEMEFEVRTGRGFSPAEERGRLPIGELPVDAIFSPVRRVNFEVSAAKVDANVDYDQLTLEIWTDGTMRPHEAMRQASQLLMRHLTVVAGADPMIPDHFIQEEEEEEEEPKGNRHQPVLYEKLIEELDLSVRVFNSLKRTGITTVGDVLDMLDRGTDAMLAIRNFGEKSLEELIEKLQAKGYIEKEDS